jgi:outer membrane immunogenic protein
MTMRRFYCAALAVVAVLGFTSVASAADLPAKAPPPAYVASAPVVDWTGPYAGIAGGWGWGKSTQRDPGVPAQSCAPLLGTYPNCFDDGNYTISGGMIGGTIGYNWQNGPWVFGVEGDYSWADISGQSNVCGPTTITPHPCGTKIESLGTARVRIGRVMGNALPYITGGWAFGNVNGWDSYTPASGTAMYSGWTIGGGVEWRLDPRWSAKIEYLYVDLGSRQLFNVVPGVPETVSDTANVIRVGLNFKFGDWARLP